MTPEEQEAVIREIINDEDAIIVQLNQPGFKLPGSGWQELEWSENSPDYDFTSRRRITHHLGIKKHPDAITRDDFHRFVADTDLVEYKSAATYDVVTIEASPGGEKVQVVVLNSATTAPPQHKFAMYVRHYNSIEERVQTALKSFLNMPIERSACKVAKAIDDDVLKHLVTETMLALATRAYYRFFSSPKNEFSTKYMGEALQAAESKYIHAAVERFCGDPKGIFSLVLFFPIQIVHYILVMFFADMWHHMAYKYLETAGYGLTPIELKVRTSALPNLNDEQVDDTQQQIAAKCHEAASTLAEGFAAAARQKMISLATGIRIDFNAKLLVEKDDINLEPARKLIQEQRNRKFLIRFPIFFRRLPEVRCGSEQLPFRVDV